VPVFDELEFHPRFEEHQRDGGRRVVTEAEAIEAWYGRRTIVRNRKRRGRYLLLGTAWGRDIVVVLLQTRKPHVWQAYTAWDTDP